MLNAQSKSKKVTTAHIIFKRYSRKENFILRGGEEEREGYSHLETGKAIGTLFQISVLVWNAGVKIVEGPNRGECRTQL